MIIFTDSKDIAVNSDKVLYYKIVDVPDECVLRAYFGKDESVLLTKGARQYLLNLIGDIAEKSKTESYMEL